MKYLCAEKEGFIQLEKGELSRLGPLYARDPFYAHKILGKAKSFAAQSALHVLGVKAIEDYITQTSKNDPGIFEAQRGSIRYDYSERLASLNDYFVLSFGPFFHSPVDLEKPKLGEADAGKIISLCEEDDFKGLQLLCHEIIGIPK